MMTHTKHPHAPLRELNLDTDVRKGGTELIGGREFFSTRGVISSAARLRMCGRGREFEPRELSTYSTEVRR